jgi:hypothetical protein
MAQDPHRLSEALIVIDEGQRGWEQSHHNPHAELSQYGSNVGRDWNGSEDDGGQKQPYEDQSEEQ